MARQFDRDKNFRGDDKQSLDPSEEFEKLISRLRAEAEAQMPQKKLNGQPHPQGYYPGEMPRHVHEEMMQGPLGPDMRATLDASEKLSGLTVRSGPATKIESDPQATKRALELLQAASKRLKIAEQGGRDDGSGTRYVKIDGRQVAVPKSNEQLAAEQDLLDAMTHMAEVNPRDPGIMQIASTLAKLKRWKSPKSNAAAEPPKSLFLAPGLVKTGDNSGFGMMMDAILAKQAKAAVAAAAGEVAEPRRPGWRLNDNDEEELAALLAKEALRMQPAGAGPGSGKAGPPIKYTGMFASIMNKIAEQYGPASVRHGKEEVEETPMEPAAVEVQEPAAPAAPQAPTRGRKRLIIDGASTEQQLSRAAFLRSLRAEVTAAADAALGPTWSVVGCPYIEAWFAKHADSDAWTVEAMAKKYSGLKSADNATDYIAPIVARLQRGIARWQAGQDISSELNAAGIGGSAGAVVQSAAAGVAEPGSVMALEEQLGAGASMDSAAAARIGAGSDASDVRVHEGPAAAAQAAARNAVAFAVGNNIVMGANAPKPGTTLGDALLAHEYAHTKQQRDANQDPAARRQAIGEEQAGPEVNADEAVVAALTGLGAKWHDVMKTGLQLQRCADPAAGVGGAGKDPATLARQLGLHITTSPGVDETGSPAVVGERITFSVDANMDALRAAGHTVTIKGWDLAGPNGGHFTTTFVGKPETTLPVLAVGQHVFTATMQVDTLTVPLTHTFKVVTPQERAGSQLEGEHAPSLEEYKTSLMFTQALMSPASAIDQGDVEFRINTASPNPALVSGVADDAPLMYILQDLHRDTKRRRWFARPLVWGDLPEKFGGHVKATMADGLPGYDLGQGDTATLPVSHKGTFVIVCQSLDDKGNPVHDARYLQAILSKSEAAAAKELNKHIATMSGLESRVEGATVPVSAMHVTTINGASMPLRLYLGKKKGDPNTWTLLDLTAGIDPERNQLEYSAASAASVLAQFKDDNKYPTGAIAWRIDAGNALGAPAVNERFETDGESTLEKLSSRAGIASLLLLGAAIIAAPFTAGGSLLVPTLLVGSAVAGVAAGALSLADHLQSEKVSTTAVMIDVAQIAASMLNAGAALKAARAGAGMLIATRGGRFLLWSAFAADGVSGLLITVQGVQQIIAIVDNDQLTGEAKTNAILRVVTNLILTGALLALSYGDLRSTQTRLTKHVGAGAEKLHQTDQLTLGLLEDSALAHLKGATTPELQQLVAMVKSDPAGIARLMGKSGLLPALRRTAGKTMVHLELELLHDRAIALGLSEPLAGRLRTACASADISGAQLHTIDDASIHALAAIDGHLAAGKLAEARAAFAATKLPATARRQLEHSMAQAHGIPDLGNHKIVDPTQAKKLFTALQARGIDIAVFKPDTIDDLVGKKVNNALSSDPMMPNKSTPEIDAARKRAEQWSLDGAAGSPSEFANRYEYAKATFDHAAKDAKLKMIPTDLPKGMTKDVYSKNAASQTLNAATLERELASDFAAIKNLGPGQSRIELMPNDSPTQIAAKVQQYDRIAYQSDMAEAYHAVKHQSELDGIVGLPPNDRVLRFAEATRVTVRDGTVHSTGVEPNGSIKVVIRREFPKADGELPMVLEAIVFVQPNGKIVMATFGKFKDKVRP